MQRGRAIDNGRCRAQRLADRLPGQRHQAGHRLTQRIESGPILVRTVLAEAGHRYQNDPGVDRFQRFVAEAHLFHRTRPEILQHDVGGLYQIREDRFAGIGTHVDANAFLAAIVDGEIHALPAYHRRVAAGFLTAQTLDLDNFGAKVGQDHPAARTRLITGQFQYAHAFEAIHGGFPPFARTQGWPRANRCQIGALPIGPRPP